MAAAVAPPIVDVADRKRNEALRAYVIARREGLTETQALEKVQHAMPVPMGEVRRWSLDDRWEQAYRATANRAALSNISADTMLSDLIARRQQIVDIVSELYDDSTNPLSSPEARHEATAEYIHYSEKLDRVNDRVEGAIDRMSTRFSETSSLPEWRERHAEILHDLQAAYSGKGPQYDLLVKRLAAATLLQEQVEAAPVSVDPSNYAKLTQSVVALTNQLQKYTEVTKSQAIREESQAMLLAFMKIVENIVAPDSPALWNRVVQEVVRRAGGTVDGRPLLAEPDDEYATRVYTEGDEE